MSRHAVIELGIDMRKPALLAAIAIAGASPCLAQDSIAQFYKGRQITVVVGSSPGGGYDIYARLMARHMGKYIPGNPSMLVTNMPGAGSNSAAAHI
jgi:tripartite-type tricarboxylate transporter receptor subunit TctC